MIQIKSFLLEKQEYDPVTRTYESDITHEGYVFNNRRIGLVKLGTDIIEINHSMKNIENAYLKHGWRLINTTPKKTKDDVNLDHYRKKAVKKFKAELKSLYENAQAQAHENPIDVIND